MSPESTHPALILSSDPVAAALIARIAEIAGLVPRFAAVGERPRDALRRIRPATLVVDCERDASTDAFFGPAMMFGARVAVFCSSSNAPAAARSRQLAERYDVAFFLLPDDTDALHAYLREVARSTRVSTGS